MSEAQELKKEVRVSDVLTMLKEGKTREEIAAHYDVSMAEAKRDIFSHEKIKNKKTHKPSRVTLIDDVAEVQLVDDTIDSATNATVQNEELAATMEESPVVAESTEEVAASAENAEQQEPATEAFVEGQGEPATKTGSW